MAQHAHHCTATAHVLPADVGDEVKPLQRCGTPLQGVPLLKTLLDGLNAW